MNLTHRGAAPARAVAETVEVRCRRAKGLIDAGEYEPAAEAMGDLWVGVGEVPALTDLDPVTQADVLLRLGALTGWIGRAQQIDGAQERAKDLLTQSIGIFESLSLPERVAEAQSEIGLCYWRQGAFDEARLMLSEVISRNSNLNPEIEAAAKIRLATVERTARRSHEALNILADVGPMVQATGKHSLIGTYHLQLATVLENLSSLEGRNDYRDRAFIEYEAAGFNFEQAGHTRYRAFVAANVGYLFYSIRQYQDAYVHLDRARRLALDLEDSSLVAQIDDTRARTLLAENRLHDAERYAAGSVRTLERGAESALLAESLTTYGVILGRRGKQVRARALLERAVEVSEVSGDLEGAGRARLAIIEELGDQIPSDQLAATYRATFDRLKTSQDPTTAKRLLMSGRHVVEIIGRRAEPVQTAEVAPEHTWENFSFKREMLRAERALIERALQDAGGVVTRAARLLGFKNHQSLIYVINFRHKDLLKSRSAVRVRRRRLMKVEKPPTA